MVGPAARVAETGVTLIEMLVVLAVFAVVAGAVVLGLPGKSGRNADEAAMLALVAGIDRVAALALAGDRGFGIRRDRDGLRFVEPAADGSWTVHRDPTLAVVKPLPTRVRISPQLKQGAVYAVSPQLVPTLRTPLVLVSGDGGEAITVRFDGARVRIGAGEERDDRRGTVGE